MHRRHTRRQVLAIYLCSQAGVLRRRVHSAISRFVTRPRVRALVIDGLRMKPRMRGPEELRRRFRTRRSRLRRGFHFAPRRDLHRLEQKLADFIIGYYLGERLLWALAIGTKFCSTTLDRGEVIVFFQTRPLASTWPG
jgi:hypothetical protein